jgi:transposase
MVALAVSKRLSPEALRGLARGEAAGKVRARMLAIARLIEGGERGATAAQFGMSRNVLRIWVGRYNEGGVAGLSDRHGGGTTPWLTPEQQRMLKATVLAGADLARDGIVAYRILDIRALAEREFGVRYSHAGMHRLLHAMGCAWLAPRPRHPASNAAAQAAFKKNFPSWSTPSPVRTPAGRSSSGSRTRCGSARKEP